MNEFPRIPEPRTLIVSQAYLENFDPERSYIGALNSSKEFARIARFKTPPMRIIDLGCGDGSTSQALADIFPKAEVMGIDSEERAIERAKKSWRWRTSPKFLVGDALQTLKEFEESFDLINISSALHEFHNAQDIFNAAYRSLRSGGHLFISDVERFFFLRMPFSLPFTHNAKMKNGREAYEFRSKLDEQAIDNLFKDIEGSQSLFGNVGREGTISSLLGLISYCAGYTISEIQSMSEQAGFLTHAQIYERPNVSYFEAILRKN